LNASNIRVIRSPAAGINGAVATARFERVEYYDRTRKRIEARAGAASTGTCGAPCGQEAPPSGHEPHVVPDVLRIHHVGIIVRDAEAAAETYRAGLGLDVLGLEDYRGEAKVALLRAGESLLHLIQPVADGTIWADALRDRGEGPHHIALEVADIHGAIADVTAAGLRTLESRPRRDPGGAFGIFLEPRGGMLIELVQAVRT
jgi:methylmalonyl-CoA/ethylmalonyl-CoA epimerase